jgi:hypothetical protein
METRYFFFENGNIHECDSIGFHEGEEWYFQSIPRNFLELVNLLKKLSFLCNGIYVSISQENMEILLFKRYSLERFNKLNLSPQPCQIEINERLKDFLFSLND